MRSPVHNSEFAKGAAPYLDILSLIHARLQPRRYLEIGVRHGHSLALAQCPALGIDPAPEITIDLGPDTRVQAQTSDAFFGANPRTDPDSRPDLVFIDGLHLIEAVLRDLINVERHALATTLVVIDDIFPNHPRQADRERSTRVWTGDVWKLLPILSEHRPDLHLAALDTAPTGLLLVAGLNPSRPVTEPEVQAMLEPWRLDLDPPPAVLERHGAIDPRSDAVIDWLDRLRTLRLQQADTEQVQAALNRGL